MLAFRVFQPFFARVLPVWAKPRDVPLVLGNYRVVVGAKVRDGVGVDDMDVGPAPGVPLGSGSLILPLGCLRRPAPRLFSCRGGCRYGVWAADSFRGCPIQGVAVAGRGARFVLPSPVLGGDECFLFVAPICPASGLSLTHMIRWVFWVPTG